MSYNKNRLGAESYHVLVSTLIKCSKMFILPTMCSCDTRASRSKQFKSISRNSVNGLIFVNEMHCCL